MGGGERGGGGRWGDEKECGGVGGKTPSDTSMFLQKPQNVIAVMIVRKRGNRVMDGKWRTIVGRDR